MTAVGAKTRVAAVIGWPVDHSSSPALHNAAFAATGLDAVFVALAVAPEGLGDAVRGFRASGFLGVSVTVPHKQRVIEFCDRLDAPAVAIGAVNCLSFASDGAIIGHNTDAGGFADAYIEELGRDIHGMRAVLLGGGGAARAVYEGLTQHGSQAVTVIARDPSRVDWTNALPWTVKALETALASADLLVDCTSAALSATAETSVPAAIPLQALPASAAVASLVYHRRPALLQAARARGLATMDGRSMLLHQGARAFRIWTGRDAPLAAMRPAAGL